MIELLTLRQAAEAAGLQPAALRRAIQRGELPAFKLCSRIRVAESDLTAWVRRHRIERSDSQATS